MRVTQLDIGLKVEGLPDDQVVWYIAQRYASVDCIRPQTGTVILLPIPSPQPSACQTSDWTSRRRIRGRSLSLTRSVPTDFLIWQSLIPPYWCL